MILKLTFNIDNKKEIIYVDSIEEAYDLTESKMYKISYSKTIGMLISLVNEETYEEIPMTPDIYYKIANLWNKLDKIKERKKELEKDFV